MFNLMTESFERIRGRYPGEDGDSVRGGSMRGSFSSRDFDMDGFFKQASEVEKQIERINTQLHKLQAANEESKLTTNASAMKAIKQRMENDIEEVKRIALQVKASLEALDKDNAANRKKPGCEQGTSVDRTRTSMTAGLKKKLKDRMSQFQILRQTIQDEYRETVQRRVFTVTGTHPDEKTIDHLIETGNSEQIFANAIQGRGEIVDTLAEIQERRDTALELERKLFDLQQIFMDMAVLVQSQGEMIDDIEAQVINSVDYVRKAAVQLQQARESQKSSRKCMCYAILLLIVMIILVLISVLLDMRNVGDQDSSSGAET